MPLSPTSGPGGGSSFNGGTITSPLVVNVASTVGGKNLLYLENSANPDTAAWFEFIDDGSGNVNVTLNIVGALNGRAIIDLAEDNFDGNVHLNTNGSSIVPRSTSGEGDAALRVGRPGTGETRIFRDGATVLSTHAAPADAALVAGDCALWFDQTNGAAKLMVKAKQADGTVKTGSLALA